MKEIKQFIDKAEKIFEIRNAEYTKGCMEIQKYLQNIVERSKISNVTVSGRVKSKKSLAEKIYRKNYFTKYDDEETFINELPDGIGIRIICLLNDEENELYEFLKSYFTVDTSKLKYHTNEDNKLSINFTNQPEFQKNGLEIYRMNALWSSGIKPINIEIQIKSLVHYFWGEVEHFLFYKNYDYILSNGFYTHLMSNINDGLVNINDQMQSLKKHLRRNEIAQVGEVREIAALILSNKFNKKVKELLKCEIDLREVYDVVISIQFPNITNLDNNSKKLKEFINQIEDKSIDDSIYQDLYTYRIETDKISKSTMNLVGNLDKIIQSKDIYWCFFVIIYSSIYLTSEEFNYTEVLDMIAKKFLNLIRNYEEIVDLLEDSIADEYNSIVKDAILETFYESKKLSFFVLSNNLKEINEKVQHIVNYMQYQIANSDFELFSKNKENIKLFVKVHVRYIIKLKLEDKSIRDINNIWENTNDYQLYFEPKIVEWLIKNSSFNIDEIGEFKTNVLKEENNEL